MRILIVDDSRLIRVQTENLLQLHYPHAQIEAVGDGEACLTSIRRFRPDIVLLDIMMPKMTGLEVLDKLHLDLKKQQFKVIMFSSIDDKVTLKECFELGASDFIQKPIEEMEMLARLDQAMKVYNMQMEHQRLSKANVFMTKEIDQLKTENETLKSRVMGMERYYGVGMLVSHLFEEVNMSKTYIANNLGVLKEYFDLWQNGYDKLPQDDPLKAKFIEDKAFQYMLGDYNDLIEDTYGVIDAIGKIDDSIQHYLREDLYNNRGIVDLNICVDNALTLFNAKQNYAAQVTFNRGQITLFEGYDARLGQVLLILLMNAVEAIKTKYEEDSGTITIDTFETHGVAHLVITDDGCGISHEGLKRMFETFYTTKQDDLKNGLGLSIAYDTIVNMHHGTISAESTLGEGTSVHITLPVSSKNL